MQEIGGNRVIGRSGHRVIGMAVLLAILLFTGCAPKKALPNVKFSGCVVTSTWRDDQGRERKDCECSRGIVTHYDAKTKTQVISCRP